MHKILIPLKSPFKWDFYDPVSECEGMMGKNIESMNKWGKWFISFTTTTKKFPRSIINLEKMSFHLSHFPFSSLCCDFIFLKKFLNSLTKHTKHSSSSTIMTQSILKFFFFYAKNIRNKRDQLTHTHTHTGPIMVITFFFVYLQKCCFFCVLCRFCSVTNFTMKLNICMIFIFW